MFLKPSDIPEDPKEMLKMVGTMYKLMFYDMAMRLTSSSFMMEFMIVMWGTNGKLVPFSSISMIF